MAGIQEGVCITLDGSCVAPLGEGRLALSLRGGQLYVLTLLADSVRTVRSFHLDRAAASVLTTCVSLSTLLAVPSLHPCQLYQLIYKSKILL